MSETVSLFLRIYYNNTARKRSNKKGRLNLLKPKIRQILRQNSNWITLAIFFFFLGIVVSLATYGKHFFLTDLAAGQQQLLQEMAELIFDGPPIRGIAMLFFNNLLASLQVVLFGVILGITPLMSLFTNGAFLGNIITSLSQEGSATFSFLALGILPHGIFELSAFFISAAFGLKIGFHLVFPLPQKKRGESIVFIWKEFWTVFPLVLNLLIIAAMIEILVTPHLLNLVALPSV